MASGRSRDCHQCHQALALVRRGCQWSGKTACRVILYIALIELARRPLPPNRGNTRACICRGRLAACSPSPYVDILMDLAVRGPATARPGPADPPTFGAVTRIWGGRAPIASASLHRASGASRKAGPAVARQGGACRCVGLSECVGPTANGLGSAGRLAQKPSGS